MIIVMQYKGFYARVENSDEDGLMIGSVLGIRASLNFHGTTVTEIRQSFHDSVDWYLDRLTKKK